MLLKTWQESPIHLPYTQLLSTGFTLSAGYCPGSTWSANSTVSFSFGFRAYLTLFHFLRMAGEGPLFCDNVNFQGRLGLSSRVSERKAGFGHGPGRPSSAPRPGPRPRTPRSTARLGEVPPPAQGRSSQPQGGGGRDGPCAPAPRCRPFPPGGRAVAHTALDPPPQRRRAHELSACEARQPRERPGRTPAPHARLGSPRGALEGTDGRIRRPTAAPDTARPRPRPHVPRPRAFPPHLPAPTPAGRTAPGPPLGQRGGERRPPPQRGGQLPALVPAAPRRR